VLDHGDDDRDVSGGGDHLKCCRACVSCPTLDPALIEHVALTNKRRLEAEVGDTPDVDNGKSWHGSHRAFSKRRRGICLTTLTMAKVGAAAIAHFVAEFMVERASNG
jgi:hypothetical protein